MHLLAQPKEGQQQFKNKKPPELTENRTAWKSDNQGVKEETFVHTSRRGRDGQKRLVARRELEDQARWRLADWEVPLSRVGKPGGTTDHTTQRSSMGK